jgi:site-specific DNA-cytosine methylase
VGGFPCKAFSLLSKPQNTDQALLKDPRARGFFKTCDTIATTQPMVCILENVMGFKRCEQRAMKLLSGVGSYFMWVGVLDPKSLGFPGRRARVYIIMIRNDVKGTLDCAGMNDVLANLSCNSSVPASDLLCEQATSRRSKRQKRGDHGEVQGEELTRLLSNKPTAHALKRLGAWTKTHWDFLRNHKLDAAACAAAMPPLEVGLPTRARHIVGVWRVLLSKRGRQLCMVNVSQSIHRAGGTDRDMMPCVTPNGAIWLEKAGRLMTPIEKWVFQGLPIHRTDVGVLTDRELESMAGNAMHTRARPSQPRCLAHWYFERLHRV